jgi:glycosyltransferase involved in cell wall biosynthesis
MRILTVTNMYPSHTDPTFGTFVAEEVAALRVHPDVQRCDVLFIDGRKGPQNYAAAIRSLRFRLRQDRFDVVHAHYGLTGAVAVTQRAVPTVITFHTGDLELGRWQRSVSRLAYRYAADSICVSRHAMAELPGPAHYLTCGIDLAVFTPLDRSEARRSFSIPADAVAVLFPSSPDRPKKAYPQFALVVAALRRKGLQIHELHLRNLEREAVPYLMAAADVMVLTSTQEGSPVAVMEALACGLPIVAIPVGDVPAMLRLAREAYVAPFDQVSFADAVREFVQNAPLVRVADPVANRFDIESLTDRLVALLKRAAEPGRNL